ncbi:MAG: UDP-N-acetylenolpyruvoylglucosamine reductase, partial [Melioribacteraceae bacterium]|nr:UDP-N-acetylenolpyruvoylglucosamine reductase [Melioribacteraceae bacterium]
NREKYTLGAEECQFGYRDSIFKNKLRGKIIITKVHLNLSEIPNPILEYNGIISAFESKKITEPTLTEIRNLIIEIRKSKLPDPYFLPNAGSFFKNPVIGQEQYIELLEEFPKIPAFVNDKNRYKIPAAWLIEQTGLKGFKKGKVGTHQNQPLVILNLGYKKGQRIIDFANYVTREVKNKFGIKLEKEVNIV